MEYRYLSIGRWDVDFIFATDGYDIDEIKKALYDASANEIDIDDAVSLMRKGDMNTGFTYANPNDKYALIVIGPTTSGRQFLNTLVHEIHHLSVAIADSLGVTLTGETPAYISGDAAMELADLICRLGCRGCDTNEVFY